MRSVGLLLLILAALSCTAHPASSPASAPPAPPSPPAAAPASAPAASPGIEEGASLEAAVIVPPMKEREGVEWENRWIYNHFGRFRKKKVALISREGRQYDVITVELADHSEKVLYFDITDFFGK